MKQILSLSLAFVFLLSVNCLLAQEATEPKPERGYYMPTRITVVYSDEKVIAQEGIPEWLTMAIKVIRECYPLYDKYLETEGFIPAGAIELRAESSGPIGWNSSTTIGFSIEWIKPGAGGAEDWGMIAHELVHFVQNYQGGEGTGIPGWATEGIGDFVRHVFFEPEKEMRAVNPDRASYTNAYQITAGFFMYICDAYDLDFVKKLNEMGRKRTYTVDIFEQSTGKKIDDLWAEYIEKVVRPLQQENKRIVPTTQFPKLMQSINEFKAHVATLSEEPRPRPQQQGQQQGQRQGQRQPQPPQPPQPPAPPVVEVPKGREPVKLETVNIIVEEDVRDREVVLAWAEKAKELVIEWYPIMDKVFETEGVVPGNDITIIFREMDSVANASGSTIRINADWVRRQPQDFGMVFHEMLHVIQRYGGGGRGAGGAGGTGIPTWAMEGITDFARHAYYEPTVVMRRNGANDTYRSSYQVTGGFFMWIEHVYDKEFVKKLNQHARSRTWSDDVFEKYTGKDAETLWKEHNEFLQTLEGNRILPSRDFGRVGLGNTYSVTPQPSARPAGQPGGRTGGRPATN
ncbi:MAG: basic secretory family protein [Planctomycetaceae bacterium]|nr:basic secretory family protein [Planctomycetaceae bacterium]